MRTEYLTYIQLDLEKNQVNIVYFVKTLLAGFSLSLSQLCTMTYVHCGYSIDFRA